VLIYFDRSLQNRVLTLFRNSLRRNGFLCLGSSETLDFSDVRPYFVSLADGERIYQYKGSTAGLSPQEIEKER
jgi:chemotaxis protein methyltransferase CheR